MPFKYHIQDFRSTYPSPIRSHAYAPSEVPEGEVTVVGSAREGKGMLGHYQCPAFRALEMAQAAQAGGPSAVSFL